jgi:glycosyltransferase involved in cell wall biosynthesis
MGHEVYVYGIEENEAECTEFLSCMSKAEQLAQIGSLPYQQVPFEPQSPLFLTFNTRAAHLLRDRKEAGDVITTIAGSAQMFVSQWHPELLMLEYSIGYRGVAADFRVYESQAWRHTVGGYMGVDGCRPFDTVIPPWFDASAVPVNLRGGDYVAYCGRLVPAKGLRMACRAAQEAGVRLVVIGAGDSSLVTYGEYAGAVSRLDRDRILAGARAVLMPTQYCEPFGNVSAEAQLCGTPVIASDWGAFTESVEQGVTGYRCSTLGEFVQAIDLVGDLDRAVVRQRAVDRFSEEAAMRAYGAYFDRLTEARTHGQWTQRRTLLRGAPDADRSEQPDGRAEAGPARGAGSAVGEPGPFAGIRESAAA